jgi:hypothetical protein
LKNKTKGISLIILVITIIVIVILTGAVILSLSNNNPINSASESVFKNDLKAFESDLSMYISEKYTSTVGSYNPGSLKADDLTAEYNGVIIPGVTIKNIIPVLANSSKYNGQLEIVSGKLVYKGTGITNKRWAEEVNLEVVNGDRLNAIISTAIVLPISAGTDALCTVRISSNSSINTINLTGKLQLLDENNVLVAAQPVFVIGSPTGSDTDTLRDVDVILKTNTLLEGKYKLRLKAGCISNIYGITNTVDVDTGVLFQIDNTPPANPTMVASPTGFTNGNVSVTVTYAADAVTKQYSTNGTTWLAYTVPVVVSTNNTTIYAKAIDISGNQSGQSTITIANIDKIVPTVAFGTNGALNVQTASTTATVSDTGGSAINTSTIQYVWDTQDITTPVSGWTVFTNGVALTKTGVTGTYYLWIKGSDNAGNALVTKSNAFTADVTPPINPTMAALPTGWTNGNVTVTITYPGDATVKEYSTNGTTWNAYTAGVVVTTNNTTVYGRAADAAGNQSGQSTITIANIDKIVPTVAFGTNGALNVQTASTTAIVSDTGGSVINNSTLQYVWDTQNTVTPVSGWAVFTNGAALTKTGVTGTYYLWIKGSDNAGNAVVTKSNLFTADVTPPTNPTMAALPTGWTNGNVTVTITYPGDATVKEYSTNGTTWNAYTIGIVVAVNNTTVYARGSDAAGNQSGQSTLTVANIDSLVPTIAFETNGGSNLQTASTTATVSDTGGSTINTSTIQYVWDTQNTVTPGSGWAVFTNGTAITKTGVTGTYYLWIKGSDNAGNSITTKSNAFGIDVTPPTNPTMLASPGGWTNGNVTVTITYPGDSTIREYSTNGTTWSAYTAGVVVTTNATTVYSRATDASGNQSGQSTLTVTNIDRTAPSVPIANFNGYATGTWTTANITLNLTSTDANSGINKYQWSTNGTTWNDFVSTWVYNYDTQQSPSFRSVDNAGNASSATVYYNIKRDTAAPTYSSYSITNITADTYDVYVYGVSDAGSGVNRLQFPTWTTYNGQDDIISDWSTNTIVKGTDLGGGTWKYTAKRSEHNGEYGDYLTHLYFYDNLGNGVGMGLNITTLVDPSIAAKFTLTAAQEIFNGSTSYYAPGEVSNNYTIEFDAQPSDTIDVLSENNYSSTQISNKHRFIVLESHGGGVPNAGLGISLGTNGLTVIAHSAGYYHVLIAYYTNLNAWNHYKLVVQNTVPRLYVNGVLVRNGYAPLSSYTKLYSLFSIGTGSYGNFIGRANNFVFYNVAK